ncbi:bifunctional diaminohydroxyphosphoribosylaminopyrimidine deaminase/5-amino-6-(5-phosphoribosylamino)uracil reductase RibD [Nonomuraea jiangxiensis]|uniref:Riboflavin biosynthesis protein RibD n=1 Tax=Nonomuraea jiangxiensis TaxID=633440 RepID=A0A1G8HDM3_9ACTN|nr:bifunctional diaminohydroxyphosphoribosylaminopyrimidine deaminase/5-amino-6-(5-phosphoribosylamino)uracil reductase RibD [Nonomuraea jiangxiensis]SDI04712.1 diaminohydroxyphosphoribosylaminopyrimidine deaminase / 5-amino-6-(5-phosphoribosylamino)uracil reductase [Nonomuraea jiangxiensis]
MEIPARDAAHMARAVELAGRGHGSTSPNPVVGCVVLDAAGSVVGEGFHAYAGGPHAEIVALAEAGERARGGTAYVTLEPCDHTGRTGPCSRALLDAGIARVVIAVADPTPKAAGGVARLRAHGVEVISGVLAGAAERVNEEWLTYARLGRSHVTWKFAATLDGRSAAADGTSQWITSAESRADVHRMRAAADAIVAGIGTVLADDPRLTARPTPNPPADARTAPADAGNAPAGASTAPPPDPRTTFTGASTAGTDAGASISDLSTPLGDTPARSVEGPGRGRSGSAAEGGRERAGRGGRVPLRVVVDTEGRTPQSARVLDDQAPTLVAVADDAATELKADLLRLPRHAAGLDLHALLRELAARDVVSVFVEGGPTLAGAFVAQGLVDRVVAYLAPALLGSGRAALGPAGVSTIGELHRLTFDEISPIGPDVRLIARPTNQAGSSDVHRNH